MQKGKDQMTLNTGTGDPRDSRQKCYHPQKLVIYSARALPGEKELSMCRYGNGLLHWLLSFPSSSSVLWLRCFGRIWFFKGFSTLCGFCVQNDLECQRHTPQGLRAQGPGCRDCAHSPCVPGESPSLQPLRPHL